MDVHLSTEQKQIMSQRMIQSAQILQMSAQELNEYVEELALENPVIDVKEHMPEDDTAKKLQKYEWLNSLDDQNSASYYQQESPDSDEPEENWNFAVSEEETLKDYLWSQIVTSDFSELELRILEYMLESLDSRGYFTEDLSETARRFHQEERAVAPLLAALQELDPAGICARSLPECLILQAKRLGIYDETFGKIAGEHLDQVAKNQLPQIAKELNLSLDEVSRCCRLIRGLDPKPGAAFSSREQLSYIVPDVTVVKFKDHFDILLNEYLYPDIRVNGYYRQLSKKDNDAETAAYLTDKIRQAEWVRDCIAKRNATLLDVSGMILKFQQDFFLDGPARLRPLRLKDAADHLGIHESTVSRAVKGKYLQCSWGVYPMNFFFSRGMTAAAGGTADVAVDQIKRALKEIVEKENHSRPFSDRALGEELEKQGMTISRRTVAKHRLELGIADAGGRKQY